MNHQIVLRVIAKMFIPFILLFALYVQFHGDFGPGGGFQAGVIFAAAFVLYGLVFGVDAAKRVAHPTLLQWCVAIGLLIYAGTGMMGILLGGTFLDYNVLNSHDPVHGQHLGILLVEFGIGLTVASVMITTFLCFAGHRPS
ncbi:MAG TPA: cation:proton antiporter [Candidatus Latescibacteria bacterium]|jgi:multicomponent Na+:H+ antiporter subunit B|nr:cation:proton antiporter [Candidatus Latescibacterota bacterium]|tara:strand:+ start:589 stop:1011 length:423 start_codon:yes stop_codon:yes gene_type:complete